MTFLRINSVIFLIFLFDPAPGPIRIDVIFSTLRNFFSSLKKITDQELNKIKKSVLHSILQKSTSVTGEAGRLFTIAFERNAEFDKNSRGIKALEKLTREDIQNVVRNYLRPSKQRKLILRMSGKNHEIGKSFGTIILSIAKFKDQFACPKNCLP